MKTKNLIRFLIPLKLVLLIGDSSENPRYSQKEEILEVQKLEQIDSLYSNKDSLIENKYFNYKDYNSI